MLFRMKTIVLLFKMALLLRRKYVVFGQPVITFDQSAREGDADVIIPCDYSKFTDRPDKINWNEVNKYGATVNEDIVNDKKTDNGRYGLMKVHGHADLIISAPLRNDSQRRFQCDIRDAVGHTESSSAAILTVYYLDDPVLSGPSRINEDDPVTLTCSAPDGDPVPYVTLYKDGKVLSNEDVTSNRTIAVFHIKAVTFHDEGMFTCKAESDQFKGNDGKSIVYHLQLHYLKVEFKLKGDSTICNAEGFPEPTFVKMHRSYVETVDTGENQAIITNAVVQSTFTCYAENMEINVTDSLKIPVNTLEEIHKRSKCGEGNIAVAAVVAFIVGSILMFLVLRYIYKAQQRKIHLYYQDRISQNQPLQLSPLENYTEINQSSNPTSRADELEGNAVVIANNDCTEVNSMYGKLPK